MSDKTKIPYFYPPYPIKALSEVTDCEHKHAQFQGMYSLIGHYHCDRDWETEDKNMEFLFYHSFVNHLT